MAQALKFNDSRGWGTLSVSALLERLAKTANMVDLKNHTREKTKNNVIMLKILERKINDIKKSSDRKEALDKFKDMRDKIRNKLKIDNSSLFEAFNNFYSMELVDTSNNSLSNQEIVDSLKQIDDEINQYEKELSELDSKESDYQENKDNIEANIKILEKKKGVLSIELIQRGGVDYEEFTGNAKVPNLTFIPNDKILKELKKLDDLETDILRMNPKAATQLRQLRNKLFEDMNDFQRDSSRLQLIKNTIEDMKFFDPSETLAREKVANAPNVETLKMELVNNLIGLPQEKQDEIKALAKKKEEELKQQQLQNIKDTKGKEALAEIQSKLLATGVVNADLKAEDILRRQLVEAKSGGTLRNQTQQSIIPEAPDHRTQIEKLQQEAEDRTAKEYAMTDTKPKTTLVPETVSRPMDPNLMTLLLEREEKLALRNGYKADGTVRRRRFTEKNKLALARAHEMRRQKAMARKNELIKQALDKISGDIDPNSMKEAKLQPEVQPQSVTLKPLGEPSDPLINGKLVSSDPVTNQLTLGLAVANNVMGVSREVSKLQADKERNAKIGKLVTFAEPSNRRNDGYKSNPESKRKGVSMFDVL